MEKILVIDSGYFRAGAIWQFTDTKWDCIRAAPIIKYMIGKTPEWCAAYIKKKNWKIIWINVK